MKARFKISMADTERSVSIKTLHVPVTLDEMLEVTKQLFLAWGFAEGNIIPWFEPNEYIMELQTKIEELEHQIEHAAKYKSNVFSITSEEEPS
jgi:hypothetical protein